MIDRKILITNDDGIDSDGILRLVKAAKKFGEVWVVAPATQQSAMSHSINLRRAIVATPYDFPVEGVKAFALDGTPADCVRVGVRNIVPGKPDVVFSGINFGFNVATDLEYSATAGAAFEASFQGIRAIAFSEGWEGHDATDAYLEQIIEELIDEPVSWGNIWNVNFPDCSMSEVKGILRDRKVSSKSVFEDNYDEEHLPDGSISFRVNGTRCEDFEDGTDIAALREGYVSIGLAKNIS